MSHVAPDNERLVEENLFTLEVRNAVSAPILAGIALIPIEPDVSSPSKHVHNHYTRFAWARQADSHGWCRPNFGPSGSSPKHARSIGNDRTIPPSASRAAISA